MTFLTVLVLSLVRPVPSAAISLSIQVPVRSGQTAIDVYRVLKDTLGPDHRYYDYRARVLRPWNITDGIDFVLPEGAGEDALEALRRVIADVRAGRPIIDPADPSNPRSVDFGDVPVDVVEPRVKANHGEPCGGGRRGLWWSEEFR